MIFFLLIVLLNLWAQGFECAPVGKKFASRNNQTQIISNEFHEYLDEIFKAVKNSTKFIDHVSAMDANNISVNYSILPEKVREKLNLLKYEAKNSLLQLYRLKLENKSGSSLRIPSDLATVLDVGHSIEFSGADVEAIMKILHERQAAIDREEILFLTEFELLKLLNRWEAHMGDALAVREKAQLDHSKKIPPKSPRFHEPGSRAQEQEQWRTGDDMSADDFSPRHFFRMHDLNGDGVWDREDIDNVLANQVNLVDHDDPERKDEYRVQMRQFLMENVDYNHDGFIDFDEHMKHYNSPEGIDDDGWQPEDDEDEDLNSFGDYPSDEDFRLISKKIQSLDIKDPNSKMVQMLRERTERLKHDMHLDANAP